MITPDFAVKIRPDCKDFNPDKHELPDRIEVKEDGYRMSLVVTGDGEVYFIGKKECYAQRIKDAAPEIWNQIQAVPNNSILDGEMFVKGGKSSDVIAAMNPDNEQFEKLRSRLIFRPFAVPFLAAIDWRECGFADTEELIESLGFTQPEAFYVSEELDLSHKDLLHIATERKIEGFVAKQYHYEGWYKIKPVRTGDFVVMEYKEGNGRNAFRLGALIVGAYKDEKLIRVTSVGGGFNDELRDSISEKDVGRVVEVSYQSVLAKGSLQFPQFLRFRDDKEPKDCKMSQLDL